MQKFLKNPLMLAIFFLFLFVVLANIPKIQNFGYYNDDWWQIYGAENFGLERFPEMYTSDRPARAYWHAFLFSLFETRILPYQITAVAIRFIGAIALLWTLQKIWKSHIKENFLISLIFLIYPGFLEQPNGFDYQIQQVAITTFLFSLGLSIDSIKSENQLKRISLLILSSLFSLITFFFMEYYVGLEIYRWMIFICLYLRNNMVFPVRNLLKFIVKHIPYSISMVFFLIWRVFFFKSTRYTTDISRLGFDYLQSPLLSIFNVFRRWTGDIGDVFFNVWLKKGYKNLYDLNSQDFIMAILLVLLSLICLFVFLKIVDRHTEISENLNFSKIRDWKSEVIIIGFFSAIICLIPINLANREVFFPIFNRFSFPSSIGVSMTIVGLVSYILKNKWQLIPYSLIILSSITTHYSNNTYYANRWKETQNLWQQWVWRVPGIEKGTILTGFYPETIQEGYFIWGPANLLYYYGFPEIMVGSEVLNNDTYKDILMNKSFEKSFRSFYFNFSFEDTLVFTKPTRNSCLRILDNNQIELSMYDHPLISLISKESKIQLVLEEDTINYKIFEQVFGKQSDDLSWCYIYEKASLARQYGLWQEIIDLHQKAQQNNLKPFDPIEWFPFLQAYAYLNKVEEFQQLVPIINETPFYRYQACQLFSNKEKKPESNIQKGNELLAEAFCDK